MPPEPEGTAYSRASKCSKINPASAAREGHWRIKSRFFSSLAKPGPLSELTGRSGATPTTTVKPDNHRVNWAATR